MMKFCCFEGSGSRSEPKIGFRFAFGQFIDVRQADVCWIQMPRSAQ